MGVSDIHIGVVSAIFIIDINDVSNSVIKEFSDTNDFSWAMYI
jgi:hypothetical protein